MAEEQQQQQPDFWSQLGQGLRGAGAILSPDVYRSQQEERQHTLINVARSLEIRKAQRALDADDKFSKAVGGLQPSAFKTSAELLDAMKGVPLDIIAESPRAQQTMQMAAQMQAREAAQEQRKQAMQIQYDRLDQQREIAEQRSQDVRLSAEERARHNLMMEKMNSEQAKMREEMQRQGLDFRREMFKSRNNPESLLSADDAKFMAEQYLAGDRTVVANLGRGAQGGENILRFRMAVTKQAKEQGLSPAAVAAKIAEFEGIKAGERTLGTRTANIEMAVSEAQQMAPLAVQASDKVDRTKFPSLNSIILAGEKGTGDENVVRLGVATNSLINIYSRAISPTGVPTVHDKEHARELLSTAWSKGQFNAAVDQMMQELAQARKAPGIVRREFKDAVTGEEKKDALKTVTTSAPKKGDKSTSRSGKPITHDGTQWVYD